MVSQCCCPLYFSSPVPLGRGTDFFFFFLRVVGWLASCLYHGASQVDKNALEQWEGNILVNCPWGSWRKWRKALCTRPIPLPWTQGHLSKTCGKPTKIKAVPSAHLELQAEIAGFAIRHPECWKGTFFFQKPPLRRELKWLYPGLGKS